MKWDTIKNKCVTVAYEEFKKQAVYEPSKVQRLLLSLHLNNEVAKLKELNPNLSIGDNLKQELWDKIKHTIDHWDIRRWKGLKSLYPSPFPVGNLTPELTDNGWELI